MQIKKGYEDITSDKNKYYLNGISYPRVSSILANIDKRPLIQWAVNVGCEKISETLETKFDITKMEYNFGTEFRDNFIELAKKEHTKLKEDAGVYGSLVHDKIECWLKKCKNPKYDNCKEDLDNSEIALENFKSYWLESGFELIASEFAVVDKELKYGGRIDILAYDRIKGDIILVDIKTGSGIWKSAKIQCALYSMAFDKMRHQQEKNVEKVIILHLPRNQTKLKAIELKDDEFVYAKKAGVNLVDLYYNLKEVK